MTIFYNLADRVGFEPTVAFTTSVFKTDALNHSATYPKSFEDQSPGYHR